MNEPKNPLPWYVLPSTLEDAKEWDYQAVVLTDGWGERGSVLMDVYSMKDAEYIVAACNAYPDLQAQADALAEALKQARVDIFNWSEAERQRAVLMGGHIAKVALQQVEARRDAQIRAIRSALTNYRKFKGATE